MLKNVDILGYAYCCRYNISGHRGFFEGGSLFEDGDLFEAGGLFEE